MDSEMTSAFIPTPPTTVAQNELSCGKAAAEPQIQRPAPRSPHVQTLCVFILTPSASHRKVQRGRPMWFIFRMRGSVSKNHK